jgi:hypothetical protein
MLVLLNGGFIKYSVEVASHGMIYLPSFVMIGSGIQVIVVLLPQQFGVGITVVMNYAFEMASFGMIHESSFMRLVRAFKLC